MFERRLKIFLALLFFMTLVLIGRAMQLQVFGRAYWREQAGAVMRRSSMVETTRGRILDRRGRPVAVDKPCIDACVDYRAIVTPPDEKWVTAVARRRLQNQAGGEYRAAPAARKMQLLDTETERVRLDLQKMWQHLAEVSGKTVDEIEDVRGQITRKVQMRRRYVWYQRYLQAERGHAAESREPSPWYQRWLIDESDAPELDQFAVEVAEQTDAHVILRAISTEVNNDLGKNLERYPGLELRPSTHRVYTYPGVASHILGHLSRVAKEDLASDPNIGNELRAYQPNDLIGRSGLEALCERLLRGQRGFIDRSIGQDARVLKTRDPVAGMDVETTIDIELQRDVEELFKDVELQGGSLHDHWTDHLPMPGAAVVIDVATNDVIAMASYPSFDLNELDEQYERLVRADVTRPLMNRATQFQLEPGSTVKPIVGLSAITQKLIDPTGTIECTGYLQLDGKTYRSWGRCWVASNFFEQTGGNVAHHPIPWDSPHPTGYLTFADAIERSCNVYFETLAYRLKVGGIADWYSRWGLGRITGVGIPEAEGNLPDPASPAARFPAMACLAGIGQDQVLATPIQMANVAATIARGGVWMRPKLVPAGTEIPPPRVPLPSTGPSTNPSATQPHADAQVIPERVDLKISKAGLAALRQGMINVVNAPAGTGKTAKRTDMLVAGKTGSAQAALITLPQRDEVDRVVRDAKGRPVKIKLEPLGTHAAPRGDFPWYRATGTGETSRAHAWFIGYAPADNPKVAFAVMVEYGGSGGLAAGGVAKRMLDACIKHGYLSPDKNVAKAE